MRGGWPVPGRAVRTGRGLAQERQLMGGLGVPAEDPRSGWLRFIKGLEAEAARWQRLRPRAGAAEATDPEPPPDWMIGRGRIHD